jgi:hypothetical protein
MFGDDLHGSVPGRVSRELFDIAARRIVLIASDDRRQVRTAAT